MKLSTYLDSYHKSPRHRPQAFNYINKGDIQECRL